MAAIFKVQKRNVLVASIKQMIFIVFFHSMQVLLVVYLKNGKRDVTDAWNQENINLIIFMMRSHKYIKYAGERQPCYFNKRDTEMY